MYQFIRFSLLSLMFLAPGMLGAQTIPMEKIEGPTCVVLDSVNNVTLPLAPDRSNFNVIITDGLAYLELTQAFVASVPNVNDIVYVFPLPHDGSVHYMAMEYKDSLYKAEIFEKEEAQRKYDSTISAGGSAALLLQNKPNVFQQRLGNIEFGDTAYIKIRVSMPLKYDDGRLELAIPTMVAQRFEGEGSLTNTGDPWNPTPNMEGQRLSINVLLQTGYAVKNLQSPTHPLVISQLETVLPRFTSLNMVPEGFEPEAAENMGLYLENRETYPNKDFVLRFERSASERDFSLASQWAADREKGYFALNLYPDTEVIGSGRPDLELILLVDVSGSQRGWPLAKEKQIVLDILTRLNPSDRFTIASFAGGMKWAFGEGVVLPATGENVTAGRNFVNNLAGGGGTYLLQAVQKILNTPQETENQRIFVFLTDGFIGNEENVFQTIQDHPSQPTIFTFGAGNNLNRYFLERTAQVGGGFATPVTSDESVTDAVDRAWEKIASPQMRNVSLSLPGGEELVRIGSPHLFNGQPLQVFGQYSQGGIKDVSVTGYVQGQEVNMQKSIFLESGSGAERMLPQIWARQKITSLMLDQGATDNQKEAIITLSRDYQVLSKYTAFLAIEPQPQEEENSFRHDLPIAIDMNGIDLTKFALKLVNGSLFIDLPAGEKLLGFQIISPDGRVVYQSNRSTGPNGKVWNGVDGNGQKAAPGKYFVRILTDKGMYSRTIFWK